MVAQHADHQRTPWQEFWLGARDTFPLIVGAIPFGIIFGTLGMSSGLSWWGTLAMSAFVYAGSAQFIAIGLLAAGSTVPLIILTTFVVNLRHLLYAASLVPHVHALPQRWKLGIAALLTDEAFAVAIRRYDQSDLSPHQHWYYWGSALFMYTNWQVCTGLGLTVGQMIPNATAWGLDFAMVVTFIGMIIPYVTTRPMLLSVIVAGLTALATQGWPHKSGLMLAAILGVSAGCWAERRQATPFVAKE